MNRSIRLVLLVLIAGLLTACATLSTSGDYRLASGQTVRGDLVLTSGNATLEEGSRVTGNVFMTSGNLYADGEVEGDIILTSGVVELGPNAVVHGDIRGTSGSVRRADGAQVRGQISTNLSSFNIGFPFFARFLLLCCVLPLAALLLIIILVIASARRRPAPKAPVQPPPAEAADPSQRLRQLEALLDEGLITQEEYEAKRAEILAEM
jgi:cytoskeletal protein CcmA (bactofilin family)